MEQQTASNQISFIGPLFVVGMPRSGTKLLRSLLNQHPLIHIAEIETHFLPFWFNHWDEFGDLSNKENFSSFYKKAISLPYFVYMQENSGLISQDEWFYSCDKYDVASVFEALIRNDTNVSKTENGIWGDKTPSYLTHVPFLKSLYSEAKVVHIVRDVRDYCLSSKNAWGKNVIRAAFMWQQNISEFRKNLNTYPTDILELRYEDLIDDPGTELQRICDFIDIPFNQDMITLSQPSENLGDAKGKKSVVSSNKGKYLNAMNPHIRRKIERIAFSVLKSYGYPVQGRSTKVTISGGRLRLYQLLDGINLVRFEARERGFFNALKFRWSLFKTS